MEKRDFREVFAELVAAGYPLLMTQKGVAEMLGISINTLAAAIRKGKIKKTGTKISLQQVANFLCG